MSEPKVTRRDFDEALKNMPNLALHDKYDKFSRQIQQNRGETDAEREAIDAQIYAKGQTGRNDIPLVDLYRDRRAKQMRFEDNDTRANVRYSARATRNQEKKKLTKNNKAMKIILAVAIAAAAIVPNAALASYQQESMNNATSVAAEIDVPFSDTYDLIILENGTAYYQNENGGKTDVINGVYADELAQNLGYDVPVNAQKSDRVR